MNTPFFFSDMDEATIVNSWETISVFPLPSLQSKGVIG